MCSHRGFPFQSHFSAMSWSNFSVLACCKTKPNSSLFFSGVPALMSAASPVVCWLFLTPPTAAFTAGER